MDISNNFCKDSIGHENKIDNNFVLYDIEAAVTNFPQLKKKNEIKSLTLNGCIGKYQKQEDCIIFNI